MMEHTALLTFIMYACTTARIPHGPPLFWTRPKGHPKDLIPRDLADCG